MALLHEDLKAIRSEIVAMREDLARLSTIPVAISDHEMRLRTIEAYTNRTKGAIAIAALSGGLLSGVLTTLVHYMLGA